MKKPGKNPNRLKVAEVITLSEIGGAQKVVWQIVSRINEEFDFVVITQPGGELVQWCEKAGIRVITVGRLKRDMEPISDLLAFFDLWRIIAREAPDVVHCHSSKAGVLGRLAARLNGVKNIIFTVHGWPFNDKQSILVKNIYINIEKIMAGITDRLVCVSNHDLMTGINHKIAGSLQFTVIHNGMDPESIGDCSLTIKQELGLPDETFLIGCVGRMADPKDPIDFINIADQISKASGTDHVKFIWIGDGPLMDSCQTLVAEKGLQDRVFLLGTREQAPALINGFDIFLLTSKMEAMPMVILEALVNGKPVVSYDVGGIPELVNHGENGFVFSPGETFQMTSALVRLINDPELCRQMGETSKTMASKFDLESTINQYRVLYNEQK